MMSRYLGQIGLEPGCLRRVAAIGKGYSRSAALRRWKWSAGARQHMHVSPRLSHFATRKCLQAMRIGRQQAYQSSILASDKRYRLGETRCLAHHCRDGEPVLCSSDLADGVASPLRGPFPLSTGILRTRKRLHRGSRPKELASPYLKTIATIVAMGENGPYQSRPATAPAVFGCPFFNANPDAST